MCFLEARLKQDLMERIEDGNDSINSDCNQLPLMLRSGQSYVNLFHSMYLACLWYFAVCLTNTCTTMTGRHD